jgi:hypothetical protein
VKKVPLKYLPVMIKSLATEKQTKHYCIACKEGTLNGIYNKEENFSCIQRNTEERHPNLPLFRRSITFHETRLEFMNATSYNCK